MKFILPLILILTACTNTNHIMFRYDGNLCMMRTLTKANCYVSDSDIIPTFEITHKDGKWIVTDIFR